MATLKPFSALVAEATEAYPTASREWIVDEVLNKLDPQLYKAYLRQALFSFYVPQALNGERHLAQRALAVKPVKAKQSHVFSKKSKITEETRWERYLSTSLNTGFGFKQLRECTTDDLLFMAQKNWDHVASNTAQAKHYEALVQLIQKTGASKLGDVTEEQAETAGILEADLVSA